ncbi:lipopolysaccharide-induced tumor necrosis factor-alpha factor isoform X2 [Thamnophis elegans]|uniref:lipopolysaccharide-induced tumor necrosis factor-alpha factor isoform X2 n=1 Tax=Thamnophis elegans TaxID=35005 RepID=UPI0013778EE3|nr:lipopolysaccharide-induced tumor necrosis factor-alpha factor isoform X2 [Thamnophis elegans]
MRKRLFPGDEGRGFPRGKGREGEDQECGAPSCSSLWGSAVAALPPPPPGRALSPRGWPAPQLPFGLSPRNMAAPSSAPPPYEELAGGSNPAPSPYPPAGRIPEKGTPDPYQPQAYGMQPQPGQAVPPVPHQTVYIPGPLIFLDQPMQISCPACNQMIVTRISYQPGALAWLSCGGLALVGCWLGCCLIPFCVDAMQDVQHFCPCCNAYLGVHKRL